MTIKEIIEHLKNYPNDYEVAIEIINSSATVIVADSYCFDEDKIVFLTGFSSKLGN